jgi:hypothetical protein
MNDVKKLVPAEIAGYRTAGLAWKRLVGTPRFTYPIDYSIAVLRVHEGEPRAEFLSLWEPGAYCHFHRHLGPTRSLVLGGALHVHESEEFLDLHKLRKTGHAASNDGGDVHMEHAGPDGALVYYDMRAPDGRLFDILADDRRILRTLTLEDLKTGNY